MIARAAGSDDAAFRLLMRTMPHHLKTNLHADPALSTQLNMIAATLIEASRVDLELSADSFQGRVLSVKGVQRDAESLALLALGLALCGHAVEYDAAGRAALKESRENFKPTVRADVVCTLARFWTLVTILGVSA